MGGTSMLGMLLGPEDTGTPAPRAGVGVGDSRWPLSPVLLLLWWWPGLVGGLLENCTVDASIFDLLWQVFKSIRWMPWHQEPKKDVVACDKPRGAGKRAVIRGCPNGETRPESCLVTRA